MASVTDSVRVKGARTAILHSAHDACLKVTLSEGVRAYDASCGPVCPARLPDLDPRDGMPGSCLELLDAAGNRLKLLPVPFGEGLGSMPVFSVPPYLDPDALFVAARMQRYRDAKGCCITYWDAEGRAETHHGDEPTRHFVRLAEGCVVEPEFDALRSARRGCALL